MTARCSSERRFGITGSSATSARQAPIPFRANARILDSSPSTSFVVANRSPRYSRMRRPCPFSSFVISSSVTRPTP